ncbi:EAL domain-containing protein [Phormidium sp. LEGE 05292]|uniref:putative bifunctional diguanylate cyclase/phosphodiesterase n=1 Tax=[Phormidium] sp. LEGE 05292 TaxID=767427 RepID=UPI0018825E05|nr:EAL domain-containing protein [Phormidium sp. LEGE 05292]MBE9229420.1 EAL domain-containing protein [Phormidium sp. LEGE 05292]
MKKIKLLIVEDELIAAEIISRNLKQQGYEVVGVVSTGEEAIQEAIANHPDLVLMDIMLPGDIDGIKAADTIHTQLQVPIVYMTAYADNDTLEKAKHTEPYGYLVKPFKPQDIRTTIEIALQRYETEKAMANRYTAQIQVAQEKLQQLNQVPKLTLLEKQFNQIINALNSVKNTQSIASVFCLRLDRLPKLNNILGYQEKELLMNLLLERLIDRLGERGILARLNNDEFAIVLNPLTHKQEISYVAQQILQLFNEPLLINSQEFFVTASIGIANFNDDGYELEELINNSKKAMNYAQNIGGNRYEFYQKLFSIDWANELAIEVDLRHAIERQELQLYYQPKVDLRTGEIVGAEALLRWYQEAKGFISPAKFIPIAEETGLIKPISDWVLQTACKHTKALHQEGLGFIRVAVNLSGYQFNQQELPQQLLKIILSAEIEPKCIELELTESLLIADVTLAVNQLKLLKSLGIKIAIDDFGTRYSSLNYLQQLPFDILKIDQCFVRDVDRNSKKKAITKTIIDMAHQLGLKVIAEGVETEGELQFLRQNGCDEMQGYLFSHPLPFQDFKQLVKSKAILSIK